MTDLNKHIKEKDAVLGGVQYVASYKGNYVTTSKDREKVEQVLSEYINTFHKLEDEVREKLSRFLSENSMTIGVEMDDCSDTHGISGDHMFVTVKHEGRDYMFKICHGMSMDASDV